jgi:hypothetical protein
LKHGRLQGWCLIDVRSAHFSFRLYALPLSGYYRTIPLRDQQIIKTHKQLARVPSPSGTINQQVCYLRGITWLQDLLFSLRRSGARTNYLPSLEKQFEPEPL